MKREDLLESREYWIAKIQIDLFEMISEYMKDNDMNQTQLANKLGVSKGYISQILNGNFDHKISKLVDLALALGNVPLLDYQNINSYIEEDKSKYIVHSNYEQASLNILKQANPGGFTIQQVPNPNHGIFMVSVKKNIDYEYNINSQSTINNSTSIKSYLN